MAIKLKSVIEGDLRNTRHINVVAVKYASEMDSSGSQSAIFRNLDTKYRFKDGDVLLVTGKENDVFEFSGIQKTIEHEKHRLRMRARFARRGGKNHQTNEIEATL